MTEVLHQTGPNLSDLFFYGQNLGRLTGLGLAESAARGVRVSRWNLRRVSLRQIPSVRVSLSKPAVRESPALILNLQGVDQQAGQELVAPAAKVQAVLPSAVEDFQAVGLAQKNAEAVDEAEAGSADQFS